MPSKRKVHGALGALKEIEMSLKHESPSREILSVKQNLKNKEIDDKVAKKFKIGNMGQMASVIQHKLLNGSTMTSLVDKIQHNDKDSASPTRRLLSLKPSEKSI